MMKSIRVATVILSSCFLPSLPTLGQTQLDAALAALRTNPGTESSIPAAVQSVLAHSSNIATGSQEIKDSFCKALDGLSCSEREKFQDGSPVQVFVSTDGKLICITAGVVVGDSIETLIVTVQHHGSMYSNSRVYKALEEVEATAEQLRSNSTGDVKILAYGAELRANRSPISITVVDVSATKTNVMMKHQHLLEGAVTHQGSNVTVQYTSMAPSPQADAHSPRVEDSYAVGTKTAVQMLHAKPVH